MKHTYDQIEIRIEKITDGTTKETFYWTYAHTGKTGEDIKLIGKSKTPPRFAVMMLPLILNHNIF